MSNMEIFIIICVCLIPIVALVILFPKFKFKKREKKVKSEIKEQVTEKYVPETPIAEEPKMEKKEESFKYEPDNFKDYLKDKSARVSKPQMKILPDDFRDLSTRYNPNSRLNKTGKENSSSLAEEINSLSPELKALILSGALDKKDYDGE